MTPARDVATGDPALGEQIRALADALIAARPGHVYREAMAAVERPRHRASLAISPS